MRVLRLAGGLDPASGGPTVTTVNSTIAARRAGAETTFAFVSDPLYPAVATAAKERLAAAGIPIVERPFVPGWRRVTRRWGISPSLSCWALRAARDYDIVHCHGGWQLNAITALLTRCRGPRIVLTPHESLTDFDIEQTPTSALRVVKRALRPALLRGFDAVVVASALEARDTVPANVKIRARPIVVPHAVYDDRMSPPPRQARPLNPGRLVAGFIGRFAAKKNLEVAIRAIAAAPDAVWLIVAGDGPPDYAMALRTLARDCGVGQRVEWLGFVGGEAKEAFFERIDVLLMPSDYECFGMAAAEALVRGIPVLLTASTGVAAVVEKYACGEIHPADPVAIGEALTRYAHTAPQLAQLGARAAHAAESEFSFSAHGAALRAVYESILT